MQYFRGTLCSDIDECESADKNNCSPNAGCENSVGSYICTCQDGFTGDGLVCESFVKHNNYIFIYSIQECADNDECTENICGTNSDCKNSVGSYTCTCETGFDSEDGKHKYSLVYLY